MNKNIFLALTLASLLAACGQNGNSEKVASVSPEQSQLESMKERAKKAVSANLKDPESAQFRNIRETTPGFLCGEVNAKNAMGGYVGFKRFEWSLVSPDFGNILSDTDDRCK